MRYAPNDRRAQGAKERRPAIQKISAMQASGSDIFAGQQRTIGLDLGDRSSNYCVLNGAGTILLEDKPPTTSQAMKQLFGRMLRSRIAMETGTHSPWVSRLLKELGHEVIVAHAQKVRLIVKSRKALVANV
jgi:transposase